VAFGMGSLREHAIAKLERAGKPPLLVFVTSLDPPAGA